MAENVTEDDMAKYRYDYYRFLTQQSLRRQTEDAQLFREYPGFGEPIIKDPPYALLGDYENPTAWLRAYLMQVAKDRFFFEHDTFEDIELKALDDLFSGSAKPPTFQQRVDQRYISDRLPSFGEKAKELTEVPKHDNTSVLKKLMMEALIKLENPGDPTWAIVYQLLRTVDRLNVLEQFSDRRNAQTLEHPRPDGSNLADNDLRMEWVFQRCYQDLLHSKFLFTEGSTKGWDNLKELCIASQALIEVERTKLLARGGGPCQPGAGLRYIDDTRKDLLLTIDSLFEVAADKSKYNLPPSYYVGDMSPIEVHFECRPDAVIDEMREWLIYDLDHSTDLLTTLLAKEYEVENRLKLDHASDYLVSKLLALKAGSYNYDFELADPTPQLIAEEFEQFDNEMRRRLQVIEENNRLRQNFRLLRDWSGGRTWKRMYLVNKPDEPYRGLQLVQQFFRRPPYDNILPNDDRARPSDPYNIASHLFGVHPVDPQDNGLRNWEEGCCVCKEQFEPQRTVVELHCGDLFHVSCIWKFFDAPERYVYRCPRCNQTPGLKCEYTVPHLRYGITPLYYDSWDLDEDLFYGNNGLNIPPGAASRAHPQREQLDLPEQPGEHRGKGGDDDDHFYGAEGDLTIYATYAMAGDIDNDDTTDANRDSLAKQGRRVQARHFAKLLEEARAGIQQMDHHAEEDETEAGDDQMEIDDEQPAAEDDDFDQITF